jgi:PIN domain nuclease of toxin-antitoxin system
MTYLLDTHTWLWRLTNNDLLPKKVRTGVFGSPPPYAVSLISVWELAVKIRKGKLALSMPLRDWIETALMTGDFSLLDIDREILVASQELPGDFHSDPADRIIVATARARGFTLVTCDDLIQKYPHVNQVWD